jgi:predicted ATPase
MSELKKLVAENCNTLIIENFCSFEGRHEFEIRPLTLLVGPNNSGKSSISKALKMWSYIVEQKFESYTELLNHNFNNEKFTQIIGGSLANGINEKHKTFSIGMQMKADEKIEEELGFHLQNKNKRCEILFRFDENALIESTTSIQNKEGDWVKVKKASPLGIFTDYTMYNSKHSAFHLVYEMDKVFGKISPSSIGYKSLPLVSFNIFSTYRYFEYDLKPKFKNFNYSCEQFINISSEILDHIQTQIIKGDFQIAGAQFYFSCFEQANALDFVNAENNFQNNNLNLDGIISSILSRLPKWNTWHVINKIIEKNEIIPKLEFSKKEFTNPDIIASWLSVSNYILELKQTDDFKKNSAFGAENVESILANFLASYCIDNPYCEFTYFLNHINKRGEYENLTELVNKVFLPNLETQLAIVANEYNRDYKLFNNSPWDIRDICQYALSFGLKKMHLENKGNETTSKDLEELILRDLDVKQMTSKKDIELFIIEIINYLYPKCTKKQKDFIKNLTICNLHNFIFDIQLNTRSYLMMVGETTNEKKGVILYLRTQQEELNKVFTLPSVTKSINALSLFQEIKYEHTEKDYYDLSQTKYLGTILNKYYDKKRKAVINDKEQIGDSLDLAKLSFIEDCKLFGFTPIYSDEAYINKDGVINSTFLNQEYNRQLGILQIKFKELNKEMPKSLKQVGSGMAQLLMTLFLTNINHIELNQSTILSEPEVFSHPAWQAKIGEVLFNYLLQGFGDVGFKDIAIDGDTPYIKFLFDSRLAYSYDKKTIIINFPEKGWQELKQFKISESMDETGIIKRSKGGKEGGDGFIGYHNVSNKAMIVETHSEYIIRKLQTLIANDFETDIHECIIIHYLNEPNQKERTWPIYVTETGQLSRAFGAGFYDEASELAMLLFDINNN